MPQPNSQSLHAQIAELKAALATAAAQRDAAVRMATVVNADRDSARKDSAELKRLVAAEREENARLRGYIQHAQEMDDAASERVAIDVAPQPLVPRTRLARQNGEAFGYVDVFPKQETIRHWTEIG